jgi:hypothetical protein
MRHIACGQKNLARFRTVANALTGRAPRRALILIFLSCWAAPPVRAQSVEDQLREMRQEIQDLRQQVQSLSDQLQETRTALRQEGRVAVASVTPVKFSPRLAPPAAGQPADPPAAPAQDTAEGTQSDAQQAAASEVEKIPMLESELADISQTKVGSNSRLPVRIFGTVVVQTAFNSGAANWLDNPTNVAPVPSGTWATNSLSMSLRQSRLGAIVDGPSFGGWKARGFLVVDFYAGAAGVETDTVIPSPRLLYGYARLEHGNTLIEAGQDQMILAPGNPTSLAALSYPELYRAGNLYLRVPQLRVQQTFSTGTNSKLVATVGVVDPDGGDTDANANLIPANYGVEFAHRPAVQARLGWRTGTNDSNHIEIGISGSRGSERLATSSIPAWAGAIDLDAERGRFGLGGEWYAGRNIGEFGGAAGGFAKSTGGYAEFRLKATERLSFNTGAGTDHLFDLRTSFVPQLRNSGIYVNTIYKFTPEFQGSAEYRWLSTVPVTGDPQRNNHLDFVLAYSF